MQPQVQDNRARDRFELDAGNGMIAFIEYQREKGTVVLVHTEVPEALSGQGVGSRLVRGALEAVRAEGRRVVPRCEFAAAWIERHPEYHDLVAQPA